MYIDPQHQNHRILLGAMPSISDIFRYSSHSRSNDIDGKKPSSASSNNNSSQFEDEYDDEENISAFPEEGDGSTNASSQYDNQRASSGSAASPSVFDYSDDNSSEYSKRSDPLPSKSSYRLHKSPAETKVIKYNQSFSDEDDDDRGGMVYRLPGHADLDSPPPPPSILRQQNQQQFASSLNNASGTIASESNPNTDVNGSATKRKTHRKQHIHPSNKTPDWMTQLAYSFRSPSPPVNRKHRRSESAASVFSSSERMEFPHQMAPSSIKSSNSSARKDSFGKTSSVTFSDVVEEKKDGNLRNHPTDAMLDSLNTSIQSTESSPLLGASLLQRSNSGDHDDMMLMSPLSEHNRTPTNKYATRNYVALAASFLRDYEGGRPPTLSTDLDTVTDTQLRLYEFKYGGYLFPVCTVLSCFCFWASSLLEGFGLPGIYGHYLTSLNFVGLAVIILDVWFRQKLRSESHTRDSRSEKLVKPMILFSVILAVENIARVTVTPDQSIVLFSSLFKPLVFFYMSSKARDALEALRMILRIVLRVIVMELLLILMFAAVASHIFRDYATFENLSVAWMSLFELSTTVVNPSLWMIIYQESKFAAIFFIIFIVTVVFYLHSLVLSVVFSTYVQAAADIHERSSTDREDAIQMAFVALQQQSKRNVVDISLVRDTLRILRPHYNAMKINALVEIVDPADQRIVDFGTFRTKIRQALNASIRTARSATALATLVELIAVCIAIVNFCYVIMVSSTFSATWFDSFQETAGSIITVVAGFELLVRFNPLRIPDFTPLTRLNATFDGIALLAVLVSVAGIIFYTVGHDDALKYILIGRALDMIRIMRFFQVFRDVVRRSSDVMPALRGPIILVVTTLHVFVYVGMALWGGSVHVGQHFGEITYLYDLNNFNSYAEGIVTMFQVLVVNDWHAIAEVFLFADDCSSPYIVYPFFILANLIGVSIMLNVLTAFFVETFVTKLDDSASGHQESMTTVQKDRDFNFMSKDKSVEKGRSDGVNEKNSKNASVDKGADADSEGSSEDLYEFDVYEREGFDKIMETVAGTSQNNDFAQQMCNYLEIFESLSPGREKVGYLICDQRTLDRFGNRRFQTKAVGFLTEQELNGVVSDMHAELLVLSARATFSNDRALIRTFPHRLDPLRVMEISASILRRHPAVTLFVLRIMRSPGAKSPPTIPE